MVQIFGALLVFLHLPVVHLLYFVNQSTVFAVHLFAELHCTVPLLSLLLFVMRVSIDLLFDVVPLLVQSLGGLLVDPLHFVVELLHVHAASLLCI